jgi:hypothetical protein
VSGSRKGVTVLGAVSHEFESFYTWSEETLTADHGVRLLRAIAEELGEKVIVLLYRAPYFYAKDLWEFVSGDRETECINDTAVERVVGETLQIWYFPSHAPELNPVENCWNQLESWFNFRLVRSVDHLKSLLTTAFETIKSPKISNYLCP